MGAAKDRTKDFMNMKTKINLYRDPSKRFGQVTNVIAQDQFASNSNTKTSANLMMLVMVKMSCLHFGLTSKRILKKKLLKLINNVPIMMCVTYCCIVDKLKQLRAQRFKPKFDDNENIKLDRQIDELVSTLTEVIKFLNNFNIQTIKQSEKELRQMMGENSQNQSDYQIRKNIQQTYLFKMQDITRQLRTIERENLMRIKDLYGDEGEIILSQLDKKERDYFAELDVKQAQEQQNRNLIQIEHMGEMTGQRSEQISNLVNHINELAVVFKELSNLVVEQGTVLDRIDFNIEQAHVNVKKANQQFVKTLKREQSWRAKGCMSCLVTWNLVVIGLLVFKHLS
ncbi:syntaxin-like protein [Stylonychia lemnae]|uniref:Syntaxin-like protein n=1 Tax=Stylonychia lemnae TaxID=5949 RepID=A0A077ZRU4_STYLE|nr:syntaxin-like protein [Stylonychia lemnae]|eukprot:CDW72075.1 syntaxin-like protein [Stylonychia lemnae]